MTTNKTETGARASAAVGGGDAVAGLSSTEIAGGLRDLLNPVALLRESITTTTELTKIALGTSTVTPPPKDKRFSDPAFTQNPFYRRLAQSYLVWADSVDRLVEAVPQRADDGGYAKFRARSAARLMTSSLAPTNFLPGNPAAIRRAYETGGISVLRGTRNLLHDVRTNRGLPSQVDNRPYQVGENLAATPGAVVHREEMFEILQYAPSTDKVTARPLLVIPPQVNKYYFLDLAPGRSLVEHLVGSGLQCFMLVWRNPSTDPEQGHGRWGMEDYVAAQLRALDVVRAISGADDVNLLAACAGGLSSAIMLGHLAAKGERTVHAASFAITMIDSGPTNVIKLTATKQTLGQLESEAARGKVFDRVTIANNFAWMRPNDLIFNYVVNNWLMGEDPPAFDVLAWNNDSTALSARFDADMLGVYAENRAARPGSLTVLGTAIDLSKVDCDTYVIAGSTDHITPWKACYQTSQVLGGSSEVVITSTGHIQTIVNPPGKARARYYHGPAQPGQSAEQWLESAQEHSDSWWPRYTEWLRARSGEERDASPALGTAEQPPLAPAPGSYVLAK